MMTALFTGNRQPATGNGQLAYGPVFVIAALFIIAGPVFWRATQIRRATAPEAYDNLDLYQEVYPTYHYAFERLRRGEVPLWNPYQLCGTPFLADARAGVFQPLNAVFLPFPTERAMAVHEFLCLFLMGTLFTLFARAMGLRYVPAIIGGVAYAFCGASAAAMSRPALMNTLVWAAFAAWSLREYARGFRFRTAVLAGLGGAMVLVSGAYAAAAAMACLLVPYAVYWTVVSCKLQVASGRSSGFAPTQTNDDRTIHRQLATGNWQLTTLPRALPSLPNRVAGLFIAAAVALAVAAVQWVPTLTWMQLSEGGASAFWNFSVGGKLPATPRELLGHLLIPGPGPLPRMAYLGLASVLLVPAACLHGTRWRESLFFAAATPLFLLLCLMPPSGPPSFPFAAFVFPGAFGLAALAALGADRVLMPRGPLARFNWPSFIAVVLAAAVLFYVSRGLARGFIIAFVVILVPAALFRARWLSAACGAAWALLLLIDLSAAGGNAYYHPYANAPACYQRYADALRAVEERALDARVLVSAPPLDFGLPVQIGLVTPLRAAGGARSPLTPEQAEWWRGLLGAEAGGAPPALSAIHPDAPQPALLNYMAVRALIASPGGPLHSQQWAERGPKLREHKVAAPVRLFTNEDAMPRAYWVPEWKEAAGAAAAIKLLTSPGFDARRFCVVDSQSPAFGRLAEMIPPDHTHTHQKPHFPKPQTPNPVPPHAPCRVTDSTGERVRVQVTAPQPGVIVLADTFAPGWKARLDGRPCPIVRVNGVFRGVPTPAGNHEIVFEYAPLSFRIGQAISMAALALLAGAGLVGTVRGTWMPK